MFGISSLKMIRFVDSPATFAASTKSRLRNESAWARRILASNAHSVRPRIRIIATSPCAFRYDETTIRSGIVGITRKTLVRKLMNSSTTPPE